MQCLRFERNIYKNQRKINRNSKILSPSWNEFHFQSQIVEYPVFIFKLRITLSIYTLLKKISENSMMCKEPLFVLQTPVTDCRGPYRVFSTWLRTRHSSCTTRSGRSTTWSPPCRQSSRAPSPWRRGARNWKRGCERKWRPRSTWPWNYTKRKVGPLTFLTCLSRLTCFYLCSCLVGWDVTEINFSNFLHFW